MSFLCSIGIHKKEIIRRVIYKEEKLERVLRKEVCKRCNKVLANNIFTHLGPFNIKLEGDQK